MNAGLIALLSIALGILGANASTLLYQSRSFGLVGNSIIGVFGSVFVIKTIGRFGIDPASIVASVDSSVVLLGINFFVSFFSGLYAVVFASWFKDKYLR